MESNDLGSKKMNNKQNPLEEFGSENHNSETNKLTAEVETNSDGEQKIVKRARNTDSNLKDNATNNKENPSSSIAVFSDKEVQRMVENKDHNSDITAHRYPNSNPESHQDRGNIKLDE